MRRFVRFPKTPAVKTLKAKPKAVPASSSSSSAFNKFSSALSLAGNAAMLAQAAHGIATTAEFANVMSEQTKKDTAEFDRLAQLATLNDDRAKGGVFLIKEHDRYFQDYPEGTFTLKLIRYLVSVKAAGYVPKNEGIDCLLSCPFHVLPAAACLVCHSCSDDNIEIRTFALASYTEMLNYNEGGVLEGKPAYVDYIVDSRQTQWVWPGPNGPEELRKFS